MTLWIDNIGYAVKKFGAAVAASQTDSELVAAATGKKIVLLSLFTLTGDTATEVQLNSDSDALDGGLFANAGNGGAVLPHNPYGWVETVAGEALTVTTGSGSATSFLGTYIEV